MMFLKEMVTALLFPLASRGNIRVKVKSMMGGSRPLSILIFEESLWDCLESVAYLVTRRTLFCYNQYGNSDFFYYCGNSHQNSLLFYSFYKIKLSFSNVYISIIYLIMLKNIKSILFDQRHCILLHLFHSFYSSTFLWRIYLSFLLNLFLFVLMLFFFFRLRLLFFLGFMWLRWLVLRERILLRKA